MIKGMEPFVGKASGPGVLGQGQAAPGRLVVGGHARLTARSVIQRQAATQ